MDLILELFVKQNKKSAHYEVSSKIFFNIECKYAMYDLIYIFTYIFTFCKVICFR